MLRQYGPGRFRYELVARRRVMPVGTVPVGAIVRYGPSRVIVEAWLPRHIAGLRDRFVARGGHLAQVRDLRTGRRFHLSGAWLRGSDA